MGVCRKCNGEKIKSKKWYCDPCDILIKTTCNTCGCKINHNHKVNKCIRCIRVYQNNLYNCGEVLQPSLYNKSKFDNFYELLDTFCKEIISKRGFDLFDVNDIILLYDKGIKLNILDDNKQLGIEMICSILLKLNKEWKKTIISN